MNALFGETMLTPLIVFLLVIASVWSLVWKGFALWTAAQLSHKWWFIALLLINTLGILEILYLFIFSKKGREASSTVSEA